MVSSVFFLDGIHAKIVALENLRYSVTHFIDL